jgi:hypothetical protein
MVVVAVTMGSESSEAQQDDRGEVEFASHPLFGAMQRGSFLAPLNSFPSPPSFLR